MGICLCGFFGFRRGILGLSSTRDCWCPYSTKGVRETGENRLLIAHQCCGQLTAFKTGYPLTSITWLYRGLKCRPIEVEYYFEVIRWQLTSFKWSQAQVYFSQWFIWNMLCLCHYSPALSRFWFQTNVGRENSATFLKIKAGKTFLTMVTRWSRPTSNFFALIGQNFTGEFMRKFMQHLESCLLWQQKLTEFLCQLVMFLTVFPLDVQNEIQVLWRVFCYPRLVCLLGFWLRNASLVKIG